MIDTTYIYRAEYDNGQSWSDHSHQTVGTFTSPDLAMEYCRQGGTER